MARSAALALGSLFLCQALAQQLPAKPFGLEPGPNSVGFQLLEGRDSRAVTGGIASTAHARPIRTYLWYPAKRAARPMSFARYAALADEDVWPPEIAGSLTTDELSFSRRPLARSSGSLSSSKRCCRDSVHAAENAKPLDGPFALIVIGLGLYYESPTAFAALAEYLAGRGFVVAMAPFTGTDSPFVRHGLCKTSNTRGRDLEFVIAGRALGSRS